MHVMVSIWTSDVAIDLHAKKGVSIFDRAQIGLASQEILYQWKVKTFTGSKMPQKVLLYRRKSPLFSC